MDVQICASRVVHDLEAFVMKCKGRGTSYRIIMHRLQHLTAISRECELYVPNDKHVLRYKYDLCVQDGIEIFVYRRQRFINLKSYCC